MNFMNDKKNRIFYRKAQQSDTAIGIDIKAAHGRLFSCFKIEAGHQAVFITKRGWFQWNLPLCFFQKKVTI